MNECCCIPVMLYLQNSAVGWIWPVVVLPTPGTGIQCFLLLGIGDRKTTVFAVK